MKIFRSNVPRQELSAWKRAITREDCARFHKLFRNTESRVNSVDTMSVRNRDCTVDLHVLTRRVGASWHTTFIEHRPLQRDPPRIRGAHEILM